nr:MAG TPA: hypothetical protein [Caudoviricetes sp.]
MIRPRLAPDGAGRGCFVLCLAFCGPIYGVLWYWDIGTLQDNKTALRACKWSLRRFCFFEVCSTLLDTSAKMPPGDHRRPRKQREVAGECRDMGGHAGGTGGQKNRPIAGRVVSKLTSGAADASIGKEKRAYLVSSLFLPY